MQPDDKTRIRHMIEAAEAVENFVVGRRRTDLDNDQMLAFALTHAITMIGEAASKITENTRASIPALPWSNIISMRNRSFTPTMTLTATFSGRALWRRYCSSSAFCGPSSAPHERRQGFDHMTGHRPFSGLTKGFSPTRKTRVRSKVKALKSETPDADLRQAQERSREEQGKSDLLLSDEQAAEVRRRLADHTGDNVSARRVFARFRSGGA
jgi:uncharacterized protein with HEPN domain